MALEECLTFYQRGQPLGLDLMFPSSLNFSLLELIVLLTVEIASSRHSFIQWPCGPRNLRPKAFP